MKKISLILISFLICSTLVFSGQSTTTPTKTIEPNSHKAFNDRVKKGGVDLVFLGDSITQLWGSKGKKVWEKYYGHRNAVNMGIGGERTQHILWRIDNGNLDGISPKVIVLMIGHNNLWDNSAEEIANGVKTIIGKIKKKTPKTKVLLMGILPMSKKPSGNRRRIEAVNKIIKKFHNGKSVHYMDIGANFINKDGTISKEVLYDFSHPAEKGFQIWAKSIESKLSKLLKDKPVKG